MDKQNTGDKIREYRKLAGLTQQELAQKSGISMMSIRRYEKGERNPTYETISKIANALETSITSLGVEATDYAYYPVEIFKGLSEKDLDDLRQKFVEFFGETSSEESQKATEKYESYVKKYVCGYLTSMNEEGQTKVLNYARDLAQIPQYQKKDNNEK